MKYIAAKAFNCIKSGKTSSLSCLYNSILCLVTQSCPTLCDPMDCSPPDCSPLLCPWGFSRQVPWSGPHAFLQGIFSNLGLNPGLPHCRWILYHLSHRGNPRILEWIDYLFSRGTSQPRNWTGVSCNAGIFFTSWAIQEALNNSTSLNFFIEAFNAAVICFIIYKMSIKYL